LSFVGYSLMTENPKVLLYINCFANFKMQIIPVMQSCFFSSITPVFSVTWSLRNQRNKG